MAKRERRQAERKLKNTKLTIFKDLYRLHQVVNTLSNRHPLKIFPTIFPCADLLSVSTRHYANKMGKLRANIASEHVTSTLVTATTAATISWLEMCHNQQ